MTTGKLPDYGADLGLPEEMLRRHQEETATRVAPRKPFPGAGSPVPPPAAQTGGSDAAGPETMRQQGQQTTRNAIRDYQNPLIPGGEGQPIAAQPEAQLQQPPRRVGFLVVTGLVVIAMVLVFYLALKFIHIM